MFLFNLHSLQPMQCKILSNIKYTSVMGIMLSDCYCLSKLSKTIVHYAVFVYSHNYILYQYVNSEHLLALLANVNRQKLPTPTLYSQPMCSYNVFEKYKIQSGMV